MRIILLVLAVLLSGRVEAFDWPQFRGPSRNGTSNEQGLVWPENGPPVLWEQPIGPAFSGVAAMQGRLYTTESDARQDYAICLDGRTGEQIWKTPIGPVYQELHYGNGPLATPTVDERRVYVLSPVGRLLSLERETGEIAWELSYADAFAAEMPQYGYSTSPLLVDDKLIIEPGGPDGKAIAALDKTTGKILWTAHDESAGYSSPILVETGWSRQIVFMTPANVLGLSVEGDILWQLPFEGNPNKAAMPLFVEPDLLFFSSSKDVGSLVVRLRESGSVVEVDPVWQSVSMRNHFSSSVPIADFIYGFDNATLRCIEVATGESRWAKRGRMGKGSLIHADGHLLVLTEMGRLLWIEATPKSYVEKGSLQVLSGRSWTEPTLFDRKLVLRNSQEIKVLDLSGAGMAGGSP